MEENLKVKIEDAARRALKNQEPELLMTLRMVLAAIKNREIEKRRKIKEVKEVVPTAVGTTSVLPQDLTEEETTVVLRSEVKKRKDAAGEFEKAGRTDLAEKEKREQTILEKYLPAEMTDEEMEKILAPLAHGAFEKDFGRVMGEAMKAVAGRASGERVSAAVKRMLTE